MSGALLGLVIGGPVGATVGAAAVPIATFATEALLRRRGRVTAVVVTASDGDPEVLLEELQVDPKRFELAARILAAAADATFDAKLTALAKVLRASRHTELAELDRYFILVRVIQDLEEADVRVLQYIADARPAEQPGITPNKLLAHFPDLAQAMRPIVRKLELHGLILDEARLDPPGMPARVLWTVSEMGRECVGVIARGASEARERAGGKQ